MIISNLALKNRMTVGVLVVLILLAGIFSYVTLPRESAPDVPTPYILVTTVYQGVAPQDVESSVTMKIEKKLTGLKGVKQVTSTSREGLSQILVEFLPSVKIDNAMQYVRDKVDQSKADLPNDINLTDPILTEINVAEFPIMMLNISGPVSPVLLKSIAERLQDAIESQPGVLQCDVSGALEREIRLEFNPDRVAGYGLSIQELLALIPAENVNISAGGLETSGTKFNVRVPAEIRDPADVDHLLLTVRNGKPIYLSDVATVRDTFKDRETYSRLDGKPSVTLAIKKRVGANIIDIATSVNAVLEEARKQVPATVQFNMTMDRSEDIRRMVGELENHVLTGLVLVVAVLMLFLGLRTSLNVALAIPLSMLIGFTILQALGITLNMIVLFSLVLALGMLVDDAIVIVENIYRHMQMGYSKIEAARLATAEVAWPVITSTATTVAAFLPLLWWEGVMGSFMKYLPITLIVTLSSSLLVALVINPVITSVFAKVHGQVRHESQKTRFQLAYKRFLLTALRHRFTTMSLVLMTMAAVVLLYRDHNYGLEYFPKMDPKRAIISIRSPQGTSVQYSDLLAQMVEERVAQVARDSEILKHVNPNVGAVGGISFPGEASDGPHVANITLSFPDFEERKVPSVQVMDRIREKIKDIPGAEIKVEEEQQGPPTGAAVTVRITGEDFATLARLSEQARALMAGTKGLINLRSDYEASRPELQFKPDRRRAMLLGVNTFTVGNFLKTALFGAKVGTYREFNDEYDITIRLPLTDRQNMQDLSRLHVPDREGNPVPLSSLGQFTYAGGFGEIHRVDQRRAITLQADVDPTANVTADAVPKQVQAMLKDKLPMPPGYTISYVGKQQEQKEAMDFLSKAFAVGLLLILLIMVMEFNSLGVPLIIMFTVVLSLVGVLMGLMVAHQPFIVIMTGLGIICLAGVVVKNGIVLMDFTRKLEKRGMPLLEAAAEAGMVRLRPVLLTAVTAILGLVPMATGVSFDFHTFHWVTRNETAQWWASMAVSVIFGLAFATLLTLVVVPTMYVGIYSRLERWGMGGLKRAGEDETPAHTTPRLDAEEEPEDALVQ